MFIFRLRKTYIRQLQFSFFCQNLINSNNQPILFYETPPSVYFATCTHAFQKPQNFFHFIFTKFDAIFRASVTDCQGKGADNMFFETQPEFTIQMCAPLF